MEGVHKETWGMFLVCCWQYSADLQDNGAYFSKMQKTDTKCASMTKDCFSSSCRHAVRKAAWLHMLAQEPVSLTAIHYHLKRAVPMNEVGVLA